MTVKISSPITGFSVVKPTDKKPQPSSPQLAKRPDELEGSTYKITTPLSEHSLYITINDVIQDGKRRPFEIFINSKNMESFSWIVALTRVISAVFRRDEKVDFLVEELRSVFDPRGGYFKPGGKYMPSLVAEIGECIEKHLIKIGYMAAPEVLKNEKPVSKKELTDARQCPKCRSMTLVVMDGCETCVECGHSKCG